MKKDIKLSWKVHAEPSAPDLRAELQRAYNCFEELPKADARVRKEFILSPLSLTMRENALHDGVFLPTILQKLEARKRAYVLVAVPIPGSYKIGVYTCVGNKATIKPNARVILERRF